MVLGRARPGCVCLDGNPRKHCHQRENKLVWTDGRGCAGAEDRDVFLCKTQNDNLAGSKLQRKGGCRFLLEAQGIIFLRAKKGREFIGIMQVAQLVSSTNQMTEQNTRLGGEKDFLQPVSPTRHDVVLLATR